MSTLGLALQITATAFSSKLDKAEQPYFLHCIEVYKGVQHLSLDTQITAIFHDLIEDTAWTISQLEHLKFNSNILEALNLLTHKSDESYTDYIQNISINKIAIAVKLSDLRHNSDITRLKGISPKDLKRIAKYHNAYTYLKLMDNEC